MYTIKGAVHRKCVITNDYWKQWQQNVKISQVISGTVESLERARDKSYVVTSKKMWWWNSEKRTVYVCDLNGLKNPTFGLQNLGT